MSEITLHPSHPICFTEPHCVIIKDDEMDHLDIIERFHPDIRIWKVTRNLPDTPKAHRIAEDVQRAGHLLMPKHTGLFHLIRTNMTTRCFKRELDYVKSWYPEEDKA